MTGQESIKANVKELIDNNAYPRFSIVVGKKGIGKKTFGKYVAKQLGCQYILWENKIDDIRELIEIMWKHTEPMVYCIPDYEDMSQGARNSLLKVCEEPPNSAYIILTSSSKEIVLPTILGRGTTFELLSYTPDELHSIAKDNFVDMREEDIAKKIEFCEVPGELITAESMKAEEFTEFVEKFWNNIANASAGNALKITQSISLKEGDNKYDINLFINYLSKLNSKSPLSEQRMKIFDELMKARRGLQLKFNKQYLLDELILNIRSIKNGTI